MSFDTLARGRIRGALQRHIDAGRLPGALMLVHHEGRDALVESLGVLDPARQVPMRMDAIFRIYSMTKPVVSLAALLLVEEGRLALTDPVGKWLPEFAAPQVVQGRDGLASRPAQRAPTVHDLLRHTAGLSYEFLGDHPVQRRYDELRLGDRSRTGRAFCAELAGVPLLFEPGCVWHYSRATDVLGVVIEAVTGQPLSRVLAERIFDPLEMVDTGFSVPERHWDRLAEPLPTCPDSGQPVRLLDPRVVPAFESGGGGLMSTLADYARFLRMMLGQGRLGQVRICSHKTIEWMTADHLGAIGVDGDLLSPGHGFGLGVAVRLGSGVVGMPGSAGTWNWAGIAGTSFFVDPIEDLFAIQLLQAPNQRDEFRTQFRNLVYGGL